MKTPGFLNARDIGIGDIHIFGQEKPKEKLDFSLKTKIEGSKISIALLEAEKQIALWVADTRDKATRRALILLGWTPPGGVTEADLAESNGTTTILPKPEVEATGDGATQPIPQN